MAVVFAPNRPRGVTSAAGYFAPAFGAAAAGVGRVEAVLVSAAYMAAGLAAGALSVFVAAGVYGLAR